MFTAMVSFNNDKLTTILKRFYDKKLNIASYDEFTEKVRDEKKNRDIEQIVNQTKTELKNLSDTIKKEIKTLVAELGALISQGKFPAACGEVVIFVSVKK